MKSFSFFSFAGCDGSELKLFTRKLQQGFKELYYSAPYHWGLVHVDLKKIITYTEGDVTEYSFIDKQEMMTEMKKHINYLRKYGYNNSVFHEGKNILEKLEEAFYEY